MVEGSFLVWMDLEMTGLDSEADRILEIATVITDIDLNLVAIGPELAIHQDEKLLESMNAWNQEHHGKSGLIQRVLNSKISDEEASEQTLRFIQKYVKEGDAPLCGNSIHQDRSFLRLYMLELHDYLSYRNIDVSSIKELSYRWFPELPKYEKENKHTALEDVYESIAELAYYRQRLFRRQAKT
ncbi:MAG: oligoribonuclease [SAR324 cluster bacterium]|nr:oligoribonuclease [SAR324 cluster bacterium]